MASHRVLGCARTAFPALQRLRSHANTRSTKIICRAHSTEASVGRAIHPDEVEKLLAESTWSVDSLLPPKAHEPNSPKITSQQLHHLLRLSALPPPDTPEAEEKMLNTLAAQLHFVGKIQEVDTTGVEPLRAIRDETKAAIEEQTITVSTLRDAFEKEKVIGTHYKRIQRDPTPVDARDVENWDVLGSASRKAGKYFVVDSERPQE